MLARTRAPGWSLLVVTVAPILAVAVLGTIAGSAPLRSLDYFWHLETGEQIVRSGAVPRVDDYTYTVPGARWIDLHWTFQLALHGLHQLGGHQAVRVAKAACVLALLAIVGSIGFRRGRAPVTALALGCMVLGSVGRLIERPELVSFVLLATVLALVWRSETAQDRWLFAIVPVQLLWANLHGLSALGIAVCAMALLAELAGPLLGRALRHRRARDLALVIALSSIVSFLNPNGADAVRMPFEQLGMIGLAGGGRALGQTILELQSPLAARNSLIWLIAAGGLAGVTMLLDWRRPRVFDGLVYAAFLALSLAALRNTALLAVVCVPIAVHHANALLDRRAPWPRVAALAAGALAVVGLALATASVARDWGPIFTPAAIRPGSFPEAAVDWIARERPKGPLYHAMANGGYLIWRLYPEYRVMVDGRLEVFGAERFEPLSVRVSGLPAGFHALDEQYQFGVALIHYRWFPGLRLLRWLEKSREWRVAHRDAVATVLVRVERAPAPDGGTESRKAPEPRTRIGNSKPLFTSDKAHDVK